MGLDVIIILTAAGVLLMLAEVFVPGGVVGTIGLILLAIAVAAGFFHSPTLGFILLAGSLVFGVIAFWLWLKLLPKTAIGKKIILQQDAAGWTGCDPDKATLRGREGTAHSTLRPSGIALIDGRRVDVVTRGEMIAADAAIRVIEVEGNRVVVTAAETRKRDGR